MPPSKPDPPRLFGTTPEEREASRGPNAVRLGWDDVPGAVSYEIMVDGGSPGPVQSGDTIGPFAANTPHQFAIRAIDNAGDASVWSDPFATVTRPPTPPAPYRVPLDLSLWGIVLRWSVPDTFAGADKARVQLQRSLDGGAYAVIATRGLTETSVLDDGDPAMRPKHYRLATVVLRAYVPGDVLQDDNRSFPGTSIAAQYPFTLRVVGPQPPAREARLWVRQYGPPTF